TPPSSMPCSPGTCGREPFRRPRPLSSTRRSSAAFGPTSAPFRTHASAPALAWATALRRNPAPLRDGLPRRPLRQAVHEPVTALELCDLDELVRLVALGDRSRPAHDRGQAPSLEHGAVRRVGDRIPVTSAGQVPHAGCGLVV